MANAQRIDQSSLPPNEGRAQETKSREVIDLEESDKEQTKASPIKKTKYSPARTQPPKRRRSLDDRINITTSSLAPSIEIPNDEPSQEKSPANLSKGHPQPTQLLEPEKTHSEDEIHLEDLGHRDFHRSDHEGHEENAERAQPEKPAKETLLLTHHDSSSAEEIPEIKSNAEIDSSVLPAEGPEKANEETAARTEGLETGKELATALEIEMAAPEAPKGAAAEDRVEASAFNEDIHPASALAGEKALKVEESAPEAPKGVPAEGRVESSASGEDTHPTLHLAGEKTLPGSSGPSPGNIEENQESPSEVSELSQLLERVERELCTSVESESLNQTKFHHYRAGLGVAFEVMEKHLSGKNQILMDLKPQLERASAMGQQIAALQAESRQMDDLINQLQAAKETSEDSPADVLHSSELERTKNWAKSPSDQISKLFKLFEEKEAELADCKVQLEKAQGKIKDQEAKEEKYFEELKKAIEAEVMTRKAYDAKDAELKTASRLANSLNEKYATARHKFKDSQKLVASLQTALAAKEKELSDSTLEKILLLSKHKEEISKVKNDALDLELSAGEAIDYVFPTEALKGERTVAQLLEAMATEMNEHCQFVAKMSAAHVLAKVKSHYPKVDEARLRTGYACEKPEAQKLIKVVEGTASDMVAELSLDP